MTRQPAEAKRFTVAWPMPREAPVRIRVLRSALGVMDIGVNISTPQARCASGLPPAPVSCRRHVSDMTRPRTPSFLSSKGGRSGRSPPSGARGHVGDMLPAWPRCSRSEHPRPRSASTCKVRASRQPGDSRMPSNLRIDPERLWSTLMETAAIGGTAKGGINRQTLTVEDAQGAHLVQAHDGGAGLQGQRR